MKTIEELKAAAARWKSDEYRESDPWEPLDSQLLDDASALADLAAGFLVGTTLVVSKEQFLAGYVERLPSGEVVQREYVGLCDYGDSVAVEGPAA